MAFCCVVGCSSHSKKKVPGLSFHEIPAREDIREKWIRAISRKDWKPSETSNYSRVCSNHFIDTDFIPGGKYKRLYPTAVPSNFPAYPMYMNSKPKRQRTSKNIEIRDSLSNKIDVDSFVKSSYISTSSEKNCIQGPDLIESLDFNTSVTKNDLQTNEVGVQVDVIAKCKDAEVKQWKKRCKYLEKKIGTLQAQNERDLQELKEIRENKHFIFLNKIIERAKQNDKLASIILDQIENFESKAQKWSEVTIRSCIILRNISPKAYQHMKSENILKLPARSTLQRYIGPTDTDTGVTTLIKERLKVELQNVMSERDRTCSLIADEMRIQERLSYDKKADQFLGVSEVGNSTNNVDLAKSLLCFVLQGLAKPFRIPVAYYFVKNIQAEYLTDLVLEVIKEVEGSGFCVIRLVTDNLKVNRTMMVKLCRGVLTHCIPHLNDEQRLLFLSFDYCHVLKNIYSQFLNRTLGNDICGKFVVMLYELQKNTKSFKPVRNLTRKHINPSNIEKMHVGRAVQLFAPPVTAALKYLKEQAGSTVDLAFKQCGPTVEFMEIIFKWFSIQDVSNCIQHLHKKMPDVRHFDDPMDDRLQWLESSFLVILDNIKSVALSKQNFLTAETHEAVVLTSKSAAACVRHLLNEHNFKFVLTRRFSSDAVESLFSCVRQLGGSHDQVDARAATHSLQKVLKTGIITQSKFSNVRQSQEMLPTKLITAPLNVHAEVVIQFPNDALQILESLKDIPKERLCPTIENASLALVAGYIARIVQENVSCNDCVNLVQSPQNRNPISTIIFFQDRGGLIYPSDNFIYVIKTLGKIASAKLLILPTKCKVLKTLVGVVSPRLQMCSALKCSNVEENVSHIDTAASVICEKLFHPLLQNHASTITNLNDCAKNLNRKPLSRKVLKL